MLFATGGMLDTFASAAKGIMQVNSNAEAITFLGTSWDACSGRVPSSQVQEECHNLVAKFLARGVRPAQTVKFFPGTADELEVDCLTLAWCPYFDQLLLALGAASTAGESIQFDTIDITMIAGDDHVEKKNGAVTALRALLEKCKEVIGGSFRPPQV